MSDKSKRKAVATCCGDVIVIRMTGGEDCLWLNMYLDAATGQMTCDSDIGSYAYRWGDLRGRREPVTDFWCRWLSNEEWLLRKCCGERRAEKAFDVGASVENLRSDFAALHNGEDSLLEKFEDVLDAAAEYDTRAEFAAALNTAADAHWIDLPEEWWNGLVEDYTPWQKRFAEICREVIVPAIREVCKDEQA